MSLGIRLLSKSCVFVCQISGSYGFIGCWNWSEIEQHVMCRVFACGSTGGFAWSPYVSTGTGAGRGVDAHSGCLALATFFHPLNLIGAYSLSWSWSGMVNLLQYFARVALTVVHVNSPVLSLYGCQILTTSSHSTTHRLTVGSCVAV